MRFTTIWTLPGMDLLERLRRTRDLWLSWLARRMPRRLAYWSLIDSGVRHIQPDETVPEVEFMTILQRAGDSL